MNNFSPNIQHDLDLISHIPAVTTILEVICQTTGMGFAAIARVTEDRWVACAVRDEIEFGLLPGGELVLETTICHEIRQKIEAVVIDHVAEDKVYARHHTPEMYGFQSYISFPILMKDGSFFGTLCAIDPIPRDLDNAQIRGMFRLFAELISFHLHTAEQLEAAEAKLREERRLAELREQFIMILGHDLRNPLAAITGSAQILKQMQLDETAQHFTSIVQHSAQRVTGLIDNVMDFAHGRMGSGIVLNHEADVPLSDVLNQVITELLTSWPGRSVETTFDLQRPVNCDGGRIAQLFSNLLSNALKYGRADVPVKVIAQSTEEAFTLSLINAGDPIPPVMMSRLFQPFFRGSPTADQKGLGLGLYIASEIARAHKGTLEVASSNEETKFTLWLPAN